MSLDENNFADGDDNINDGDTADILVCHPSLLPVNNSLTTSYTSTGRNRYYTMNFIAYYAHYVLTDIYIYIYT